MKSKSFKNSIFGFLSKVKIKKFLLVIYCVVPILILSVGFAAWRITGNETFGANGSFVSYPIINSYDYVTNLDFQTEGNGLYPTRFYDKNGNPVSAAKFDATATINLSKCRNLLNERKSGDVIYAVFTLSFSGGTKMEEFFNNLSLEVSNGSSKITKDGGSITIDNINVGNGETVESYTATITDETTNTTKTTLGSYSDSSYTVQLKIEFSQSETATSENNVSDLKLTYTLNPDASDYQTLYNELVNQNLQFMVDVKITDINPNQTKSSN